MRARDEAKAFLLAELARGPVRSAELRERAKALGIGWRTVERARRDLGIEARRLEGDRWSARQAAS